MLRPPTDPAIVSRAIEVGATGYVLKDAAYNEVVVEAFVSTVTISATSLQLKLASWRQEE
jgi:DNA-binding NarL/FixJ family response regulator